MIRINKPYIYGKNNEVYLISFIEDESRDIKEKIYYKTTSEYGKFLNEEVADAFVVGVLMMAMKLRQDIEVKSSISERLYHNLNTIIIPLLSESFGWEKIRIIVDDLFVDKFDCSAVATGCSLGVDSFSSMMEYSSNICTSYNLTHLTYFNVGAHGYKDLDKVKISYDKDYELIKNYADKKGYPLVILESNISIMFDGLNYNQCGLLRNMGAVLAFQKLFKKYIYASGHALKDVKLSCEDLAYYETILLPALSTHNTDLIVGDPQMRRTDKTLKISTNEDTYEYLYVCWKELIINNDPNSILKNIKDNKLNCTRCEKCIRTVLTLDIIGVLDKYNKIFDLDYYKKNRDWFIGEALFKREKDVLYSDIYDLMKQRDFKIPFKATYYRYRFAVRNIYYKFLSLLKRK